MLDWLWIIGGAGIAILFFNIIEDWTEIGPIDHDEPEDP